jgi:hypothetical protein
MASVASSTGYLLPISKLAARPAIQPARRRTTAWPWRAIADTVSGLTFLSVLGWELWRIAGQCMELGTQVAAAGGGYLF